MSYARDMAVEFNHCDPAGIVFFPRYFEMVNSLVENFFADRLDHSFARITMEEGCGVPTVRLSVDFRAPSRLGERLAFTLRLTGLGRSSADFAIRAECHGETRIEAQQALVWVNHEGRAAPWPPALRRRLEAELEKDRP